MSTTTYQRTNLPRVSNQNGAHAKFTFLGSKYEIRSSEIGRWLARGESEIVWRPLDITTPTGTVFLFSDKTTITDAISAFKQQLFSSHTRLRKRRVIL